MTLLEKETYTGPEFIPVDDPDYLRWAWESLQTTSFIDQLNWENRPKPGRKKGAKYVPSEYVESAWNDYWRAVDRARDEGYWRLVHCEPGFGQASVNYPGRFLPYWVYQREKEAYGVWRENNPDAPLQQFLRHWDESENE